METETHRCVTLAILLTVGSIGPAVAQAQDSNTAYGNGALVSNTTGVLDSAFGVNALYSNTSGSANTAHGYYALSGNTIGRDNTATGAFALFSNTTGNGNTANGRGALAYSGPGSYNTATGSYALNSNYSGGYNTAMGYSALIHSHSGTKNTAVGGSSLFNNTTGNFNVAIGNRALLRNMTGSNNIAIGYQASYYPRTGSNNIEIGAAGASGDNAVIRIGTPGTQSASYLAGVSGVNAIGGVPVMVTPTGQLGVVSSSRRYKEDIQSMGNGSERLLALRPVTFRYKQADERGRRPKQYGLVAEEVAQVMPELVVYNDKGQPESVAYQTLAPLLLNELQREHERVVMQERKLASMQAELADIAALRAEVVELRRLTARLAGTRE